MTRRPLHAYTMPAPRSHARRRTYTPAPGHTWSPRQVHSAPRLPPARQSQSACARARLLGVKQPNKEARQGGGKPGRRGGAGVRAGGGGRSTFSRNAPSLLPGTGSKQSKKKRLQGKHSRLSVPAISLLPKPQTPLKSPGPHGCCEGGGGERVPGGAWGCGSALSRADRCGAVSGAVPVRLPVHAGGDARPTRTVPTPFCFPRAEATTLKYPEPLVPGPAPGRAHWLGRGPGPVNPRRRGTKVEAASGARAAPPLRVPAHPDTRRPAGGGGSAASAPCGCALPPAPPNPSRPVVTETPAGLRSVFRAYRLLP